MWYNSIIKKRKVRQMEIVEVDIKLLSDDNEEIQTYCLVDDKQKYKSLGYRLVYNDDNPILCIITYKGKTKEFIFDSATKFTNEDLKRLHKVDIIMTLLTSCRLYESFDGDLNSFLKKFNPHNNLIKELTLMHTFNNTKLIHDGLLELFH